MSLFAHSVYFTLADPSEAETLLEACRTSLTGYPGQQSAVFGLRATGSRGPMADDDFDVAVHLTFDSQQSFEAYAASPRHVAFATGRAQLWSRVRDFDAVVEVP